jgi:putative acetyltransferase
MKTIRLGGDRRSPTLGLEFRVQNQGSAVLEIRIGLEVPTMLLGGGGNPAGWIEVGGRRAGHDSTGTAASVGRFVQGNDHLGIAIELEMEPPGDAWWAPIETVSNSESGFERVYQGSGLLASWLRRLEPGQYLEASVRLTATIAPDPADADVRERAARKEVGGAWRPEVGTEQPADREAVRDIVNRAFGQSAEADLIDALRRDPAWIAGFSVVAHEGGRIVGHALLTRLRVGGEAGLALAPVAVAPEVQRRGVGSAMVSELLRRARAASERLVVVVGDPAYYARFGFLPAADLGLEGPSELAGAAFQALRLGDPAAAPRGRVRYPAPFGIADQ